MVFCKCGARLFEIARGATRSHVHLIAFCNVCAAMEEWCYGAIAQPETSDEVVSLYLSNAPRGRVMAGGTLLAAA